MKKIFYTILIVVIAFTFTVPLDAQAANPPKRYYVTYRKALRGFLTNWRTNAPETCVRDDIIAPNGFTSDCLSNWAISSIMLQLDNGGYFKIADPYQRRLYLLNTHFGDYGHVIKKVVMWFEEKPTVNNPGAPNVWIYQANDDSTQNYGEMELTLKMFVANLGGVFPEFRGWGADWLLSGDSTIRTLAFKQTSTTTDGFPILSLRPKSEIPAASLDKIYNTRRMTEFKAMGYRTKASWVTTKQATSLRCGGNTSTSCSEVDYLNEALFYQNKVLAFIQKHPGKSAYFARNYMLSVDGALVALNIGAPKIAKVGGTFLVKAARPILGMTLKIGAESLAVSGDLIAQIFQYSKAVTKTADMYDTMEMIQNAAAMIAKTHAKYLPNLGTDFVEIIGKRFKVTTYEKAVEELGQDAEWIGWYDFAQDGVTITDKAIEGKSMLEATMHELTHAKRARVLNKLGINAEARMREMTGLDEAWTEYDRMQTLVANGGKAGVISRPAAIFFEKDLVPALAQRQGISNKAARDMLQKIFDTEDYDALTRAMKMDRPDWLKEIGYANPDVFSTPQSWLSWIELHMDGYSNSQVLAVRSANPTTAYHAACDAYNDKSMLKQLIWGKDFTNHF